MGSLLDAIEEEPERFVNYAFNENSNIKDFSSFKDAMLDAFNTPQGKNAYPYFNDSELKAIFESEPMKEKLRANLSDEELQDIYEQVDRDEVEFQRKVPKGEKTNKSDIVVVVTPKNVHTSSYRRSGREIRAYNKGYTKWSRSEIQFLKARKARNIKPKQVIKEYNEHFKEKRSSDSVRTRLYRV